MRLSELFFYRNAEHRILLALRSQDEVDEIRTALEAGEVIPIPPGHSFWKLDECDQQVLIPNGTGLTGTEREAALREVNAIVDEIRKGMGN